MKKILLIPLLMLCSCSGDRDARHYYNVECVFDYTTHKYIVRKETKQWYIPVNVVYRVYVYEYKKIDNDKYGSDNYIYNEFYVNDTNYLLYDYALK